MTIKEEMLSALVDAVLLNKRVSHRQANYMMKFSDDEVVVHHVSVIGKASFYFIGKPWGIYYHRSYDATEVIKIIQESGNDIRDSRSARRTKSSRKGSKRNL